MSPILEPDEQLKMADGLPSVNYNQQEIANLAFQLWEQRGQQEGGAEEDWLIAESLLSKRL